MWAWRPRPPARALASFENVRRRLELRGEAGGVKVYDDFAHHPTAMRSTVNGLRRKVGLERILAVFEPRSNTMKLGAMKAQLPWALEEADLSFCLQGDYGWERTGRAGADGRAGGGGRHGRQAGRRGGAGGHGPATMCCA